MLAPRSALGTIGFRIVIFKDMHSKQLERMLMCRLRCSKGFLANNFPSFNFLVLKWYGLVITFHLIKIFKYYSYIALTLPFANLQLVIYIFWFSFVQLVHILLQFLITYLYNQTFILTMAELALFKLSRKS